MFWRSFRVFAKSSFQAFCKVCADASGGEHARRREQYPLLYEFVEKRLLEVEKAYERSDAPTSPPPRECFPAAESVLLTSPKPSQEIRSQVLPEAPTETPSPSGNDSEPQQQTHHQAKKGRSGKLGFPFRRRRSSFMSEAAKS